MTLIETWTPGPLAMAGHLKAWASEIPADRVAFDIVDPGYFRGRQPYLSAKSVKPHIDPDIPEWTVLWVLRAGAGHEVWQADHIPKGYGETTRRPLRSPHWKVPVIAGNLILLNVHRTHWLPRAEDNGLSVFISIDFDRRPTRQDIEVSIHCKMTRLHDELFATEAF